MAFWQGYLVAVLDSTVEIFTLQLPETDGKLCATLVTSVIIPWSDDDETAIAQACLVEIEFVLLPPQEESIGFGETLGSLRLLTRTRGGFNAVDILDLVRSPGCSPSFSLIRQNPALLESESEYGAALLLAAGTSGSHITSLLSPEGLSGAPPILSLACTHMTEPHPLSRPLCGNGHLLRVRTNGFPLLQFCTTMFFDDANGILVLGTSRGELAIARFADKALLNSSSILDNLPVGMETDAPYSGVSSPYDLPSASLTVTLAGSVSDGPSSVL